MPLEDVSGDELGGDAAAPAKKKRPERAMGFKQSIAAGATADVIGRPQKAFTPERLSIITVTPGDWEVADIKVGTDSQMVSSVPLAGDMFSPSAVGMRMEMDEAIPGIEVTLKITNTSGGALTFKGALIGPASAK